MIAKPVLIFLNRHMRFSIGDLEKSESGEASADFVPNWNFATLSEDLSFPIGAFWEILFYGLSPRVAVNMVKCFHEPILADYNSLTIRDLLGEFAEGAYVCLINQISAFDFNA